MQDQEKIWQFAQFDVWKFFCAQMEQSFRHFVDRLPLQCQRSEPLGLQTVGCLNVVGAELVGSDGRLVLEA